MSKDITAKLKRLGTICKWIADNKRESFTADELAQECGVSRRTILRDIALLKEAGLEFDLYYGNYYINKDFSFEKVGLTSQIAATLCIAYETAKQAGETFAPTCQYIRRLFTPNTRLYEINPKLSPNPIVCKLQEAIKEKRYIKIVSNGRQIYAKPYCLIRRWETIYLVFATIHRRRSVWGYELEKIEVEKIESVRFEAKSSRVKNGHFASLGVPKYRIDEFIRDYF
ncbi:MAG: helix-turn-helix transcriptional regulator [Candidatus Avelusimicrobium sp.]|uniref:helix-turn-helix transcriptional regulator n=1 Tax=Candidatus Avelusimicrobium sp. TaxID=3048833 RepID=UPI003F01E03E